MTRISMRIFIAVSISIILGFSCKNTINATIPDGNGDDLPYLYVVSTSNDGIDENTARIVSYNDDGIYQGFVTISKNWDNVGIVNEEQDTIYDSKSGMLSAQSYGVFTLSSRTYDSKPSGPWGEWSYNNTAMQWYLRFDSNSCELTLLSSKISVTGSAITRDTQMTYDSSSNMWCLDAMLSAGTLNFITTQLNDSDPVVKLGSDSSDGLSVDGGYIIIDSGSTYNIQLDISDPQNLSYEITKSATSDSDTILNGSFESKFNRYSQGDSYIGESVFQWSDLAWRGDRIHKQLILWCNDSQSHNISYDVSELKSSSSTISSENVRLRFGSYVYGDAKAYSLTVPSRETIMIADALSEDPITTLTSDDPIKVWITVDVPQSTAAGTYTGTIDVASDNGESHTFTIEIEVVNRVLPDVDEWDFHLDIWQFPFQLSKWVTPSVELFSDQYFSLMEPFYTMLADAGQKAITTYIKDPAFLEGETMVDWSYNSDNQSWSFDFTSFEKYVTKMQSWGINKQISCFTLVGWNSKIIYYDSVTQSNKTIDYEVGSDEFNAVWNIFLTDFKTFLDSKGWFDKTVLYMDEIHSDQMTAVISLIKDHNEDWKIGVAGSNQSDNEDLLYDYSVILSRESKKSTDVSTFYTSNYNIRPNSFVTLENSPAEMTWLAWHAAGAGYDGFLRWAYDYWTLYDPTNIQDGGNSAGDFSMIYRTNNTTSTAPVSSIRWELMREGVQDYEKLRILNDASLNSEAAKFTDDSGYSAESLVEAAQALLKEKSR